MRFCIDTSFFIEGWRHYSPEVFPSLWNRIGGLIEAKDLVVIHEVWLEIERKDDSLKEWLKNYKAVIAPLDESTMLTLKDVLAQSHEMVKEGKNRDVADPFVVAFAKAYQLTVVTEEKFNKKHGIPEVCKLHGVESINSIDLLRRLSLRF